MLTHGWNGVRIRADQAEFVWTYNDRLRSHGDTRRAFHVADLSDAEADKLIAELQDCIDIG